MKIKTSDLEGEALDWAVAKCETVSNGFYRLDDGYPSYSTNWSQGGPIIEREIESLYEHKQLECWAAKSNQGDLRYGPTILIAAMRCYVASKLGTKVDVPEELL